MAPSPDSVEALNAPPAPVWDEARLWHAGWGLGLLAAAAALLIGLGGLPLLSFAALLIGALPAALYVSLGHHVTDAPGPLTFGWAMAGAAAAALTGGLGGPLALWCALPLLASLLVPGGRAEFGLTLSLAATAVVGVLQYAGALPPPLAMPAAAVVGAVGLLALVAGGGRVLVNLAARAREAEQERALMARFAAGLPVLSLALDRRGVIEAAYGEGMPGLHAQALDAGLIGAALPEDRAGLMASLVEALEKGAAETVFRPLGSPATRLALSLRRSGEESLSAVLAPVKAAAAEPAGAPDPALAAKLAAAIEERDAALATASARARFLANMSHELRTPLNAIMGFSDIMRSRLFGELSQRYGDYAELIHESGRHLLDLINDVLDMSKIEADRYELAIEDFDIREAVNQALRLVRLQADEAGVALRGVLPNDELMVEADRRAIKQTVLNLVSNALKFTPRGGQVTVTVAAVDDRNLELTVADTGVGIAPEDLQRLGQPYEQAGGADQRSLGTGLGLSLVKALARLHGGSMTIESQLGEGAAVTVRLPVLMGPHASAQPGLPFEAAQDAPIQIPAEAEAAPERVPQPEPGPEPGAGLETAPQAKTPEIRPGGAEVISLNLLRPNFGGAGGGGTPPNVA